MGDDTKVVRKWEGRAGAREILQIQEQIIVIIILKVRVGEDSGKLGAGRWWKHSLLYGGRECRSRAGAREILPQEQIGQCFFERDCVSQYIDMI